MSSLNGNVVAITGAGSGIGRELARKLAEEGCHLALADIDGEKLEQTMAIVDRPGLKVTTHVVDVAQFDSVRDFAGETLEKHGRVDWVINNAGIMLVGRASEVAVEDFERLMKINFFGAVYGTQAFLPHLLENGSGGVVNISSLLGLIGAPTLGIYSASKFAVRGFTESLQMELLGTGVRAVCVHPGGIKTDLYSSGQFYSDFDDSNSKEEWVERFLELCPTTPERAASKIVRGIKKGANRILVGPDAIFLERLPRWFPKSYPRLLLFLHRFR
ncbi:MAG: SDR family oxidoreductase [Candidatus Omnitrophica bacterium]|nr:SDR family oxidoreductase [Candidatus Omnitrophota bacterium]